jgi:predicted cobalt transporter CbtA
MNIALMQLFNITGLIKKAVIFSDSTAARQSLAKADAPPRKRVTEIKAFRKA